jgi:hypothetical protein
MRKYNVYIGRIQCALHVGELKICDTYIFSTAKKNTRTRHNTMIDRNPSYSRRHSRFQSCVVAEHTNDRKRPTNIHKLTKIYLSQRTAVMRTNNVYVEVSKSCPQGSCFGNGVWNIQYNSLLSLELREKIKTIVFGDESFVSVKTASIREAENNTN